MQDSLVAVKIRALSNPLSILLGTRSKVHGRLHTLSGKKEKKEFHSVKKKDPSSTLLTKWLLSRHDTSGANQTRTGAAASAHERTQRLLMMMMMIFFFSSFGPTLLLSPSLIRV